MFNHLRFATLTLICQFRSITHTTTVAYLQRMITFAPLTIACISLFNSFRKWWLMIKLN